MTQQEYEVKKRELWIDIALDEGNANEVPPSAYKRIFNNVFDRAYALGKQEKEAEKKPSLTDKEVYALESAISELESLMDGTLDEDYHKENKIVINALKRIIKKYEKK